MKICYVASPDIHTDNWLRYFVDYGDEVHIITSSANFQTELQGKVSIHYLKHHQYPQRIINYAMNSIYMLGQVKGLLKDIRPDILHAQYIGDLAVLAAASGFYPFIATAWGSDVLVTPNESLLSKMALKYVLNHADIVTCDGEKILSILQLLSSHPKVIKIYHGVDTSLFKPSITRQDDVVISTRRLEPLYDVGSVIQAVVKVRESYPVKMIVAGDGSQRGYLEDMVSNLKAKQYITFLGSLTREELAKQLGEAGIYTTSSLSDTTSVSLLEAMACGLPVIATNVGENSYWIKNGINGYIVESAPDIAVKLLSMLGNKAEATKMGAINRATIDSCANYCKEMATMREIYGRFIK